jgi:hypothetical protein
LFVCLWAPEYYCVAPKDIYDFITKVCSKPNNLKVIGKKKTKGAKKDSKNQLRSLINHVNFQKKHKK